MNFTENKKKPCLTIGYSPCPNDTYIFGALAAGLIELPEFELSVRLHDVETLNTMAFTGSLEISKLSVFAWLQVKQHYHLLQCGAALGYGCGPLVVARRPMTRQEVINSRIVLPGPWTTAHLLFRLWAPEARNRVFASYDRIFDMIATGSADCGVIIHESRFTYAQAGFTALADLGAFWEQETGMPIPLGCIAAKKELGEAAIESIEAAIRSSMRFARKEPRKILPYIREHAQEMEEKVLQQHIDTFVNQFSWELGPIGQNAVAELETRARAAGVLP